MRCTHSTALRLACLLVLAPLIARAEPTKNPTYVRLKSHLNAVPAIDTHDHLWPFDQLPGLIETDSGRGMTLFGLWRSSYYPRSTR